MYHGTYQRLFKDVFGLHNWMEKKGDQCIVPSQISQSSSQIFLLGKIQSVISFMPKREAFPGNEYFLVLVMIPLNPDLCASKFTSLIYICCRLGHTVQSPGSGTFILECQ